MAFTAFNYDNYGSSHDALFIFQIQLETTNISNYRDTNHSQCISTVLKQMLSSFIVEFNLSIHLPTVNPKIIIYFHS